MSRFAGTAQTARPHGPMSTISDVQVPTYEGGRGFAKDARTELFGLAVTNFVSGDTFYEKAIDRDKRFVGLVREVSKLDPAWMAAFLPWLRQEANMRTASVIAAVEHARALAEAGIPGGRQVIAETLTRADEPMEALAYWLETYGRSIPMPVKRGIADAAVKLFSQNAALKYDSTGHNVRMFDVIELCHPTPKDDVQAALFKYLGDRRHNRDNPRGLDKIGKVATARANLAAAARGEELEVSAGMTWEQVISAKGASKEAWESVIPQMNYMALLRNLRNFEDHGVDDAMLDQIAAKLRDPAEVAKSRQFPFRFWSAWKNSGTMRFGSTLDKALDLSLLNIGEFRGKTLSMIDVSHSMTRPLAPPRAPRRGPKAESVEAPITMKEAAVLFGAAVLKRSAPGSELAVYATDVMRMQDKSRSLLRTIGDINEIDGVPHGSPNGHGTNTWPAVVAMWEKFGPFDRILIFTDGQSHPSQLSQSDIPKHVPIYMWDLAGYSTAGIDTGAGRYQLAGLTDHMFKVIRMLENMRNGVWPWEVD